MVGGNIQLKAIGKQDTHLIGNPQITFFKSVYRRHTNFYSEYKNITFENTNSISFGQTGVTAFIKKDGDLIGEMYLEVVIKGLSTKSGAYTVNHFGNSLIKKVDLNIGGRTIDTHHSQWLQIYKEL